MTQLLSLLQLGFLSSILFFNDCDGHRTGVKHSHPHSNEHRRDDYSERALKDEITDLPGLSSDIASNYRMFSGYINVNESHGRNLFYWFVESLNDPTNDPIALWTNGGPGCSGLGGMFTENGPFRVDDNYTLYVNNYSWVNVANMIFFEQPAGVGYSYSLDTSDYTTNDNKSAIDNYEFIKQWLTVYPNYQSNDFYITSESYGGHYMPTLARQIVKGLEANDTPVVNFKGFFVGNPYTDPVENAKGQYDTWYGHQMVSLPTYSKYVTNCDDGEDTNSLKCDEAEVLMNEEIGENVDPYALNFPVCERNLSLLTNKYYPFYKYINYHEKFWFLKNVIYEGLGRPIPRYYQRLLNSFYNEMNNINNDIKQNKDEFLIEFNNYIESKLNEKKESNSVSSSNTEAPFAFPPQNYHACESNWATVYLNRKDVQNAIHALNTTVWTSCSFTLNYSMADSNTPMYPIYNWLKEHDPSLHITVVSGDDDSVCGTIGTQFWMWNMDWTLDENYDWNPWYVDDQVAGYHTKWTNNISLVTIHSAGHMIPETQPKKSLLAFEKYLAGTF